MMRTLRLAGTFAVAGLLLLTSSLEAQVGGRLRQQVQNRVNRQVDEAIDRTLDRVECAITDQRCIERAQAEGKQVKVTDASGNEVVGGAATALRPGQGAWNNYDFVPGERVVFAEDFTRDRVGNFPQRLEFHHGNMEVVEWQGRRWLQASAKSGFIINLPETLPERFTMEFDLTLPWNGVTVAFAPRKMDEHFLFNGTYPDPFIAITGTEVGLRVRPHQGGSVSDPRAMLGVPEIHGELVRVRIHADGRYVKVYLNEKRVANVPNGSLPRSNQVYVDMTGFPPEEARSGEQTPTLITAITINAGGSTLYDALMAEGRVVTQGILFDTGSDRLRPESTPTLREIADMLKQNPQLRLSIEGHTDNTGSADANQKLSEQRAAAVREFLVSTHGIDGGRLETVGHGPGKPIGENDTPEGRQNNRRVELVRLQ